jgi:hypothetical protein
LIYGRAEATTYYKLPTPYVTYEAYVQFAGWQLADLALFRHAPHVLKPWIYNNQTWRLQNSFGDAVGTRGRRYGPVNGEAFLADYTSKMRATHDVPTYKYIHVGIPHWPVSVDANCEYIGAQSLRRPNYTGQSRCAVRRVGELLSRLRELGLYDSSLIVVSSDHGVALSPEGFPGDRDIFGGPLSEMSGSSLALLVVKPPHSTGPLRISEAPSAISDVPATIVDTLGLKNPFVGTSALKLDEHAPRPRQFASYLGAPPNGRRFFPTWIVHRRWSRDRRPRVEEEEPLPAQCDCGGGLRRHKGGAWRARRIFQWLCRSRFTTRARRKGVELGSDRLRRPEPDGRDARQVIDERGASDQGGTIEVFDPSVRRRRPEVSGCCWIEPAWKVRGDRRIFGVMTRDLKWTISGAAGAPRSSSSILLPANQRLVAEACVRG